MKWLRRSRFVGSPFLVWGDNTPPEWRWSWLWGRKPHWCKTSRLQTSATWLWAAHWWAPLPASHGDSESDTTIKYQFIYYLKCVTVLRFIYSKDACRVYLLTLPRTIKVVRVSVSVCLMDCSSDAHLIAAVVDQDFQHRWLLSARVQGRQIVQGRVHRTVSPVLKLSGQMTDFLIFDLTTD